MKTLLFLVVSGFCLATSAQAGQPVPSPRNCERQLCNDLRNCSVGKRTIRDLRQQQQQGPKAETSQGQSETCRDEAVFNYQNCAVPALRQTPTQDKDTPVATSKKAATPSAK